MAESFTSATSVPTAVLQWNCRGLRNKATEVFLRLREKPIPVLALCEGCLPSTDSLPGYVKYTRPSLPTFLHCRVAVHVAQSVPQCRVDTSSLPSGDYECVAVRVKLASTTLTTATVHLQAHSRQGVQASWRACAHRHVERCWSAGTLIPTIQHGVPHPLINVVATWRQKRREPVVANNGSPTFLRSPVTTSAIDVTFHTPDLPVTWRTSGSTEGSDHFPIHIGLDGESRSIATCLEIATKTLCVPAGMPDPDLPMHNLVAVRKRAQRRYRRSRTNEDKHTLKKTCTMLYCYCRRHRRSQWAFFCRSLLQGTVTSSSASAQPSADRKLNVMLYVSSFSQENS